MYDLTVHKDGELVSSTTTTSGHVAYVAYNEAVSAYHDDDSASIMLSMGANTMAFKLLEHRPCVDWCRES